MTDKNRVGVTVTSHEREDRTLVDGYVRGFIHVIFTTRKRVFCSLRVSSMSLHTASSLSSISALIHLFPGNRACWVARDSSEVTHWGAAKTDSGGMNSPCAKTQVRNCDAKDKN